MKINPNEIMDFWDIDLLQMYRFSKQNMDLYVGHIDITLVQWIVLKNLKFEFLKVICSIAQKKPKKINQMTNVYLIEVV